MRNGRSRNRLWIPHSAFRIHHFAQAVYDCIYVALAEQEKSELASADTTMVRVLQPTFPFIRTLSSFP
jgi:predicted nucleic acid-binding protein